ncbi:MAG: HXXEE domain-containing protein [Ginsengibacter sp.]
MQTLRKHWFDIGGVLGIVLLFFIWINSASLATYNLLMWLSLVTLFFHQVEEYRWPGTFPFMINKVLFKSNSPDVYPLNSNTALIINVGIGWLLYFFAALFGTHAIWLGLATILVSIGNFIAHTFLFNIKGHTFYNAGMFTACLLFAPCAVYFFYVTNQFHLITSTDYLIGIPLGIILNFVGVLKMIDWLKNKNSRYHFQARKLWLGNR